MLWGYVALWPRRELPVLPDAATGDPLGPGWRSRRAAMRVGAAAIDPDAPPLPRARLLTQARVAAQPAQEIGSIDVATTALLAQPVALDPGTPGEVSIVKDAAGAIELAARAPGRQLLVVSEAWHEGWRCWIDGAPVETLRVYGDYLGCVVPAGAHGVRLHFEPQSFRLGAQLSALGLAGVALWLALALVRTRMGRPPGVASVPGDAQR